MLKAYKYRIYPTVAQKKQLAHHFGCARWVYNWALDSTKKHYEVYKKQLSRKELQQRLVALKRTENHAWLKEVNSQALLSSLLHLHTAYNAFFKKKARFPTFKKKHNRQSYQCPQHVTIDIKKEILQLPKIKNLKIKLHRVFNGNIKTVTISQTPSGKYFASVLVENSQQVPTSLPFDAQKTVGIDLGLTHFAITRHGEKINAPKYLKSNLVKLGIAQKERARKKKNAYNYKKKSIEVAKIDEKVARSRYDFIQAIHPKVSA